MTELILLEGELHPPYTKYIRKKGIRTCLHPCQDLKLDKINVMNYLKNSKSIELLEKLKNITPL
jgi:hypothetical protein